MIYHMLFALTLISALGCGLVAGIFFAFSSFVMGALGRIPPAAGIAAMQAVNVEVFNPWFMGAFFGTASTCIVLAIAALVLWTQTAAVWLLIGSVLYVAGSILVTMLCNVPLNNALAQASPDSAEGAGLWSRYLTRWTQWNHVRTVASLAAAASQTVALYLQAGGLEPG
ncbi:MAG: anthrone oxygenase family protein [Dongiaceae bacterium]